MPIHAAAQEGHRKVVDCLLDRELLLSLDFDLLISYSNLEGKYEDTEKEKQDLVDNCLEVQFIGSEQQGRRPIHFALENRRYDSVQLILERCLEYFGNEKAFKLANECGDREDEFTPLHIAASAGDEKSVYSMQKTFEKKNF